MRFLSVLSAFLFLSCGSGGHGDGVVRLDLETRRPVQLISFYLGAYGSPEQVSNAVLDQGGGLFLDSLSGWAPTLHELLVPGSADGVLDRLELVHAVSQTYASAIAAPATRQEFLARAGLDSLGGWMTHEVSGSMTRFRRRLHIRERAVREALALRLGDGELEYAPGTMVIGEHLEGDRVVETTGMIKRVDGFWDYLAYDASGRLAPAIEGDPDSLSVPQDCFGCHYGTRLFEPERSFPGQARPGPFGERAVHVGSEYRRPEAARFLDEHRSRSDGLLGLYGTLLSSRMLAEISGGEVEDSLAARLVRALR